MPVLNYTEKWNFTLIEATVLSKTEQYAAPRRYVINVECMPEKN